MCSTRASRSGSDPASDSVDDPILDAEKLRAAGRLWAGELDPADPRVSPLFGSLDGLPAMTVYSGSLDVLAADTVRLGQRAAEEAADITFVMYKGGIHGWPGFGILPEARRATKMIHAELAGR